MQTEIDLLKQRITELETELKVKNIKYVKLKAKIADLEAENIEYIRLKVKIAELEVENIKFETKYAKYVRLKAKNAKLETEIEEYTKKLEFKKNRKFQIRCIQIAKEILNEKPIIKYCPSFLNGLEFDAFFQKY